ncbi:MAG: AbrB/MazE/SpoVT family DNA-binding domain-containing protein [Deltaproteobacteria bacterium]|nr:AbrB/MazE/SpoVT family DNA-binding domain-containing protein [Deltaproteobacteria bacterium]
MLAVCVSSKGQVVIPRDVRAKLGLRQGDRLEVSLDGELIVLRRIDREPDRRDWRRWEGVLAGTTALQDHLAEHREEVERDVCVHALRR